MRADFTRWNLFALYFLIPTSLALPYVHLPKRQTEALAARASYLVVPVDGGAAATGGAAEIGQAVATVTIILTATETAPAPPPATVTLVKTQVITPAAIIVTSISTTTPDKEIETLTVTITHDVATTVVRTSTGSTSTSSSTSEATSTASDVTTTQAATITKTYDNGLWHTTYPAWPGSSSSISSPEPATTVV